MSAPLLQGDLADRLLPAVLGEIHRRNLSGRLEIGPEDAPTLVLQIAGGQCSCPDGDPNEAILRTASLSQGPFRLVEDAGAVAEGSRPLAGLVLAAARTLTQVDRVRAALGSLESPPALTDTGRAGVPGVQINSEEAFLLSRVDGNTSVREICQLSPTGEVETMRSIYGLTAAGLLRLTPRRAVSDASAGGSAERQSPRTSGDPLSKLEGFLQKTAGPPAGDRAPASADSATGSGTAAAASAPQQQPADPPSREHAKLEERLRLAERQNHYEILGVPEDAQADEVRKTYYALARRFHPDHFHREEVRDLYRPLEILFGRMTEAYQILSDPDARMEYDRRKATGGTDNKKIQEAAVQEMGRENYRRGRALAAKGQFVKALPHLEQAVKSDATHGEYFELLGAVQTLNPRFKVDALANLRRATELSPTSATTWLMLGLHYTKYQSPAEAVKALRQALGWDSSCEPARVVLPTVEAGGGKESADAATQLLRQILRSD